MKYLLNRMMEIRKNLGPLLKELNLTIGTSAREIDIEVYFYADKKDRDPLLSHSPVSIVFASRLETGQREASWTRAHALIEQHEARPLGDTGWAHRRWWTSIGEDLPAEPAEMWSFLEKRIREEPMITMEKDRPMEIDNGELVDTFLIAQKFVEGLSVDRRYTESGSVESLVFEDIQGREVRLEFDNFGNRATAAFVDGEHIGSFARQDTWLAETMRAMQQCRDEPHSALRR